jgi:hypothetical protein
MTRAAQTPTSEPLLELLAAEGEMKAQDFLTHVRRTCGDYLDFYPVAALLHAGYITTDSETSTPAGKTIKGKLGGNLQATAVFLCQLVLPVNHFNSTVVVASRHIIFQSKYS